MAEFKILVAEDDDDDYFIVSGAFDEAGVCELVRAHNGLLLIDFLDLQVISGLKFPDLILMDIHMPKMNGIKTLELIKSSDLFSAIPVIMYSTANNGDQEDHCYRLGASGFTTKANNYSQVVNLAKSIGVFLNVIKIAPLSRFVDNSTHTRIQK